MKRAQGEANKLQRRKDILDAARILVSERGPDAWRLEEVSSQLGLAKGTLYLYFPTRYDMLAALLREELELWRASFEESGAEAALTQGLTARPLLVRLMTSLHMSIEAGLGGAGLLELKSWLAEFLRSSAAHLEKLVPALAGSGERFMLEYYALVVGAAQLAYPPDRVAQLVADRGELSVFRIELGAFLDDALRALLAGYAATRAPH